MFTAEELAQIIQAVHLAPSTVGAAMAFRPTYDKLVKLFQLVKEGRRVAAITSEELELVLQARHPGALAKSVAPTT